MRRYWFKVLSCASLTGLLGGCAALPPAVMLASYALDGVSYLATGKSGTDHMLSAAMAEDCAVHRVVTGGAVCQAEALADLQTASLAADDSDAIDDGFYPAAAAETATTKAARRGASPKVCTAEPAPRYFLVVGSFSRRANAERATARAASVAPTDPVTGPHLVSGSHSGRSVYRVVLGPFDHGRGISAYRQYVDAGFGPTWPVPACATAAAIAASTSASTPCIAEN